MVEAVELLFPALGLAVLAGGVALVRKGRFYSRQSERLAETEVSAVDAIERGTVAVRGTARVLEDTVTAPLSKEDALVAKATVTARDDDDDGPGRRTLLDEERAVPFVVDDGTGTAVVDPPADGDLRIERTVETQRNRADPAMADFAEDPADVPEGDVDVDVPHRFRGARRRYEQAALVPGEEVYVYGEAEDRADWDGEDYEIGGGEHPERFVVSDLSREEVQSGGKIGAYLAYAFGSGLSLVGLLLLLGGLSVLL